MGLEGRLQRKELCYNLHGLGIDLTGSLEDEEMMECIQKSWDQVGCGSDGDAPPATSWTLHTFVLCILTQEASLLYIAEQGGRFSLERSLCRGAISGCSQPRRGNCGRSFPYTLALAEGSFLHTLVLVNICTWTHR